MVQELRDILGSEYADTVRAYLVHGNAVDVLLRAAEDAEAMVVGSRGRGGFARALLGSVSQNVAQHAKCPVVIVRPDASPVAGLPALPGGGAVVVLGDRCRIPDPSAAHIDGPGVEPVLA